MPIPKNAIDLHTHTTASDGIYRPRELITLARKQGLSVIAVTDHDAIKGIPEAIGAGKKGHIEVIPGVELTVDDDMHKVFDIHILGLFIDYKNKKLENLLAEGEKARIQQKANTIKKLQELGYKITFSEVKKYAKGSMGRPHIAAVLLKNHPELFSKENIFAKLLGNGKAAYCGREMKISLKEAIATIHRAKGIASLAHPLLYGKEWEKVVEAFGHEQGDAVEAYYPYGHTETFKKLTKRDADARMKQVFSLASLHNLLLTGGSDFHGDYGEVVLGSAHYPESEFHRVKQLAHKMN